MIVIIGLMALLAVLGAILYSGRGASMIAGYNTLPKEEQEKYDRRALTRFTGKLLLWLSLSMGFWVLSLALGIAWLFTLGLGAFFGLVLFGLLYANTGDRFRKTTG